VTPEGFIENYAEVVFRSAVSTTIESLARPSGRQPPSDRIRASAWFGELDKPDQAMVRWLIAAAAHAAAFGALAMIDGVRQTGPDRYELVAVDADGVRSTISHLPGELHDLFQGVVLAPDGTLLVPT